MGVRVSASTAVFCGEDCADFGVEEEKKVLLSMLGKLYVTSNSDAGKLKAVGDLVYEALDAKIASDATGRNALMKLQTAVTKSMGDGKGAASGRKSMAPTVPAEDEVVESVEPELAAEAETEAEAEEPLPADDDTTKMSLDTKDVGNDSIVNDLLDDDDEL